MNRVASRQRIRSWDLFDASGMESVDSNGYESDDFDYLSCLSQSRHASIGRSSSIISINTDLDRDEQLFHAIDEPPSLSQEESCQSISIRKKRDSTGQIVSKTVSFLDLVQLNEEHSNHTDSSAKGLLNLNTDVQLLALSFLGLPDLKALASTCKFFHQTLTLDTNHGEVRNTVWWNLVTKSFPHVSIDTNLSPAKTAFASHKSSLGASPVTKCSSVLNFCSLLSNAAPSAPSDIHNKYFSEQSNHLKSYVIKFGENKLPLHVIQFKGQVGIGDRSIRTNYPLPRPLVRETHTIRIPQFMGKQVSHSSIFGRFRCNLQSKNVKAKDALRPSFEKKHSLQPFVSPYVSRIRSEGVLEMDFTPRLMGYFEVSILPIDESQEPKNDDLSIPNEVSSRNTRHVPVKPCVAVGISIPEFTDSTRMPGWDIFSYGFHGDDGGIFHGKGDMLRVFGPTYNVGDTVGCGVNYENGGIFYTLNGEWLGYAFLNEKYILDGKVDLFPTIGIDSNHPLACNFGNDRPFIFNFAGLVANEGSLPIPKPEQRFV